MKKIKPKTKHYYTYRVIWSEDDAEYVGLCTEFPSLSYLASTPEKAVGGIISIVDDVAKDMKKNGEPIPEPLSIRRYSGKFVVRVPPEVHRELTIEAAEENISLNRLVNARLCSKSSG